MRESTGKHRCFLSCGSACDRSKQNAHSVGRAGRSKAIIQNIIIPDRAGSSAGDCFLSAGAGIVRGGVLKNTDIPIKIYRYE